MEFKLLTEFKTKDDAIQEAMDWQNWQAGQNLSIGELSEWQSYFENIADKFNLLDEFQENGII
jgi:hypothetical protein